MGVSWMRIALKLEHLHLFHGDELHEGGLPAKWKGSGCACAPRFGIHSDEVEVVRIAVVRLAFRLELVQA
jgi:hypothetical protein